MDEKNLNNENEFSENSQSEENLSSELEASDINSNESENINQENESPEITEESANEYTESQNLAEELNQKAKAAEEQAKALEQQAKILQQEAENAKRESEAAKQQAQNIGAENVSETEETYQQNLPQIPIDQEQFYGQKDGFRSESKFSTRFEEFTPSTPVSDDEKLMATLIYVLGFFIPIIGPLVIWMVKKDDSAFIDFHGREYFNFLISTAIYNVVSFILTIVLIGILGFIAISIYVLVVTIMGAMKAYEGKYFRIPFTIRVFNK